MTYKWHAICSVSRRKPPLNEGERQGWKETEETNHENEIACLISVSR